MGSPETTSSTLAAMLDHFDRTVDRIEEAADRRHSENITRIKAVEIAVRDVEAETGKLTDKVGRQNGRVGKLEGLVDALIAAQQNEAARKLLEEARDEGRQDGEAAFEERWKRRARFFVSAFPAMRAAVGVILLLGGLLVGLECG